MRGAVLGRVALRINRAFCFTSCKLRRWQMVCWSRFQITVGFLREVALHAQRTEPPELAEPTTLLSDALLHTSILQAKNVSTTSPPFEPLAAPQPSTWLPRRRSVRWTTSSSCRASRSTNSTNNRPRRWPSSGACCHTWPKRSSWRCCTCRHPSQLPISMRG